jgi:hypothetical protein
MIFYLEYITKTLKNIRDKQLSISKISVIIVSQKEKVITYNVYIYIYPYELS